jgi:chromosome segregation ATPase
MAVLGRVVCPHCGKLTIKGRYCMNCGKELEAPPAQVTTPVTPQPEAPPISVTPGPAQPTPPPEQRPVSGEAVQPPESVRETAAEEIAEERRVVEQLSKLYNWQIKLINLFLEGESTPEIFTEIYSDYESRIKALNEKRLEMIGRYEARMKELTQRLETLKLRHEVSEISQREYIRQKIEIDNELSKLKPKLAVLQNPIEIKIGEIPKFREEILRLIESVKTKGPQLNLPQEFVDRVVNNLNALLDAMQDLVKQYERIRTEIQKLEVRYKVGELPHEEYLSQRRRLERQLELTS